MNPAVQTLLSYGLALGLAGGCALLIAATLGRLAPYRRTLAWLGTAGIVLFFVCMLALAAPFNRLYLFYYWLFTLAVVGGGIGCVSMRNVFHAALMLILSLFGVAGYFILVNAEFLAMVQVIIYIGGIMVLFLFGIMVSQNIIGTEVTQNSRQAPWAGIAAAALFGFMLLMGLFMTFPPQPGAGLTVLPNNTHQLGWALMATYTLPFEIASLMLLMAMLGAIVLVRRE